MNLSVLVVDDEQIFRRLAEETLGSEGFTVRTASSLTAARSELDVAIPDVIILDRRLPDGDGICFLTELRESGTQIAAKLVVTAYGDVENAVQALRAGADDYLTKPLQVSDLVIKLHKLLQSRHGRDGMLTANAMPHLEPVSPLKKALLQRLHSVAASPYTPVLITGPSGSGKRYVAQQLHMLSHPNDNAPFVSVDCATLPEDTIERELFGYAAKVLPNSTLPRPGYIEMANRGTLYLNEVTEIPLRVQGKLLHFLDSLVFRRLGSDREHAAQVRVVAATHHNIASRVAKGLFRAELYHRLMVFSSVVPGLAEAHEDIKPLAESFVRYFADRVQKRLTGLTDEALKKLLAYEYPGNIRELRNIIERAVILTRGPSVSADDIVLPDHNAIKRASDAFFAVELGPQARPLPLEHVERQYVARVLMHYKGHRTVAAEALGISYPTFLKRLRELGFGEEAQQQLLQQQQQQHTG